MSQHWDYVIPYDQQTWEWLEDECYAHPPLHDGNRSPTTGDVKWACDTIGISPDSPLAIDGDSFDGNNDAAILDGFTIRGDWLVEIQFLRALSERCGQLFLWSETGGLPVIVDRSTDAHRAVELIERFSSAEDGQRSLFAKLYAPAVDGAWRTETVMTLARSSEASQAFDRLPILADALEEAGCTDEAILSHCRGPGPHVRGCWVVDLLLEKE